MKQKLSIGDKINYFTVIDTNIKLKPYGYGVLVKCNCGKIVGPIPEIRLFKRGIRDGIKSCKSCAYKIRGNKKRLYTDGQARHAVYSRYKVGAQRRNLEWNIDKKLFFEIIIRPCIYCGDEKISYASKPKNSPWQQDFYYTGIDRIDSNLGYINNNIEPCCKWCNIAKSNRSKKDFIEWFKKVNSTFEDEKDE